MVSIGTGGELYVCYMTCRRKLSCCYCCVGSRGDGTGLTDGLFTLQIARRVRKNDIPTRCSAETKSPLGVPYRAYLYRSSQSYFPSPHITYNKKPVGTAGSREWSVCIWD